MKMIKNRPIKNENKIQIKDHPPKVAVNISSKTNVGYN